MTDNTPDLADIIAGALKVSRAQAYRMMAEAVRLNAQAVPDTPTWEQVQKAWYEVGADVAGLDWSVFAGKVSAAPAAPQPAQSLDDESDALTIAYLHGHGKGKDSVQPLLAEKDALLRQALEALEGFANITNDSRGVAGYHLNGDTAEWDEFDEVDAASNTIESIRSHLGAKND